MPIREPAVSRSTLLRTAATVWAAVGLFTLIPAFAEAQTVAWKDLPRLVGAFLVPDPMNRDSFDVSKIVDWYIDSVDSNGYPLCYSSSGPKETEGRRWLRMMVDSQNPYVCDYGTYSSGGGEYLYYMMTDINGLIYRWDALTIWRLTAHSDSVEFVTAQGGYGMSFGREWIANVTTFPDGSTLLHMRSLGGDDELWGGDAFLRADSLANFKTFWNNDWESDELDRTYVIADKICSPVYEVVVVTEYLNRLEQQNTFGEPLLRIGSVSAEVVNLWSLAKEHFKLRQEE